MNIRNILVELLCAILIEAALPVLSRYTCANNNRLIYLGTSQDAVQNITDLHNYYRLLIAHGNVTGQPQGANLRKMVYDYELEEDAREVTLSCGLRHITITNSRWYWIGQNIFMEYAASPSHSQNWEEAIKAWFDEQENYTYPDGYSRNTRHYTQLVWADTYSLGCDFALFYEYGRNSTPYGKLYSCIYGPGGNLHGQAPYIETEEEFPECIDLC